MTRVPVAVVAILDVLGKNARSVETVSSADHAIANRVTRNPHVTEKNVMIAKSAYYADHVCAVMINRHVRV